MGIDFSFTGAARRHFDDAKLLEQQVRAANAGQLYGFCAECGLKALLVAHGLPTESSGDIQRKPKTGYREHMPSLGQIVSGLTAFPDGRQATRYVAMLPGIAAFSDWSVDHRYYDESRLPLASLPGWRAAATEVMSMLDQAIVDGVMQ